MIFAGVWRIFGEKPTSTIFSNAFDDVVKKKKVDEYYAKAVAEAEEIEKNRQKEQADRNGGEGGSAVDDKVSQFFISSLFAFFFYCSVTTFCDKLLFCDNVNFFISILKCRNFLCFIRN